MPAGRPSKYDPAFCEVVIDVMRQGYSKTAAAAEIGVDRGTLAAWAREHPEFHSAVRLAEGLRTKKLEADLLAAEAGPVVTSRIFALKNAAPDEWRDKVEHEHTHRYAEMTDEELAAELAALEGESDGAGNADAAAGRTTRH